MFSSVFNEKFRSNPLCDFRLGTVATSDHETALTGCEPKKDLNLVDAEELDLVTTSDIYWQHTLDDDASLNDPDVDDNQLAKYLAIVVGRTGKPVEMRSNSDQFSCDTRNLKSAQNQFPLVTQPEMICQTGGSVQTRIAEERESAHAQIRTMLDEQRRTIIAECSEKVLHHELLAAQAEQDRKILQAKVTVTKFGNSQRSLLSPTGGVKSIPPTTENLLRKQYKYSKKNYKSTEDKHETNHINNKYNDMNMNMRKVHNTRT